MRNFSVLLSIGFLACTPAHAANLIVNGSFENDPLLGTTTFVNHVVGGTTLPNWEIVGPTGARVTQLRSDYADNPPYTFPAQDGILALDLTGFGDNLPTGVRQSIATSIGDIYELSFWVGNVSGGIFGTSSTVGVEFSSGGSNFDCVNSNPGTTLNWIQCSTSFTATATSTAFTFRNLDPNGDNSNFLDNVSVELVSGVVPEPTTWAMSIIGFGLIGLIARRRARNATVARFA